MERLVNLIFCLFLIFSLNSAYAARGCCSHHGGVKGCDASTGRQLCKDGTTSPSCPCSGASVTKTKKSTTVTTSPASTSAETTTVTKSKTEVKKTKGCCARHGGVAGCDSSGYSKCKDGTVSPTCTC